MFKYQNLIRAVLHRGMEKQPVRVEKDGEVTLVENDTIGLPNQNFNHWMTDGFPLLTTKKVHMHSVAVELEGFLKGVTSKKWYQDRKCRIWNEWANPIGVNAALHNVSNNPEPRFDGMEIGEVKKILQAESDDLGPFYGFQWNNFGGDYNWRIEDDDKFIGINQIDYVLETLRKNPNDRRMVVSAWNPNQKHAMALPPCHLLWIVTTYGGKLHLHWTQRSCDLMLGVPFNIASYALLLVLLAKHAGLEPGNLDGSLVDCHIYKNHIDGAHEQLKRAPRPLPTISIEDNCDEGFDVRKWTHENYKIEGYDPHPAIKFGKVTV